MVPFPPTNVHACEVSDTYVVLSWNEPEPQGREPLTFYVERVRPSLTHTLSLSPPLIVVLHHHHQDDARCDLAWLCQGES